LELENKKKKSLEEEKEEEEGRVMVLLPKLPFTTRNKNEVSMVILRCLLSLMLLLSAVPPMMVTDELWSLKVAALAKVAVEEGSGSGFGLWQQLPMWG
jgi:hypothetical protein